MFFFYLRLRELTRIEARLSQKSLSSMQQISLPLSH
jgi:hypothetical protein